MANIQNMSNEMTNSITQSLRNLKIKCTHCETIKILDRYRLHSNSHDPTEDPEDHVEEDG